jgi:hypothetical protein
VEASRARISQSGLKTGRGTTQMVYVVESRMLRRVEGEDGRVDTTGCIRPFYHNFVIFIVLGTRGIKVF